MIQAFFNVMLRNFGVEGIKVQEVFSLDDEMLNLLPFVFLLSIFKVGTDCYQQAYIWLNFPLSVQGR